MGFFKNLKKRLFTLNIDDKPSKKTSLKKVDTNNKKQDLEKDTSNNLVKKKQDLQKNVERDIKKRARKEKKINKYVAGMKKSGFSFAQKIQELQSKHNEINEDFFDELEDILIMADISVNLVMDIISEIKKEVKIENVQDPQLISEIIADKMFAIYTNQSIVDTTMNIENEGLNVMLVVGVNGSGKTTTIAKIANMLKNEQNKKVIIAAADTFRAGAVNQLGIWSQRIGVDIIKPKKEGADPGSVVYDALEKSKQNNYDVLIIDTAGRLQNKINLMNELEKINRIIQREIPNAPHESLLVLDATTGQNGVSQAKNFKEVTPLSGIILTKMDGTSKGGIILTIKDQLKLSVKMIGLGEKIDDLQEFDLDAFIYGMTKDLMGDK